MSKIDISVVILNYKSWDYLEKCLQSFQDFPPSCSYEIIVVDNDSQDGQFDDFKSAHPDITLVANSGNHGFSHGCNFGASYAQGEYLFFLNPDTELTADNAIDTMLAYAKTHQDSGIVSCRNVNSHGIGRELTFSHPALLISALRQGYKLFHHKKHAKLYPEDAAVWHPDWVVGSVVLIKTDLFQHIEGWNQKRYWMYHEDPDLCNRVRRAGKTITLLRDTQIKHIGGGSSRKDDALTLNAKTEIVISGHNYIQENLSTQWQRNLVHLGYMVHTMTPLFLKALLLCLFKPKYSKVRLLLLVNIAKYYCGAIKRRSWLNPRLAER